MARTTVRRVPVARAGDHRLSLAVMDRRLGPRKLAQLLSPPSGRIGDLARQAERLRLATEVLRQGLGQPLAEHCVVAALAEDGVVIQTDSAAWASRVRFSTRQVLAALAPALPGGAGTPMRVTVQPVQDADSQRPHARRASLSEESRLALERAADATDDPALRDALRRLSRQTRR